MNIPWFTLEDWVQKSGLRAASARVDLSRKTAAGKLVRVRRNLYVPKEVWDDFSGEDFFRLANIVQTPSAISFLSALSYYGLSTQIVASTVESLNPLRKKKYDVQGMQIAYYFCKKEYFFGIEKEKGFFITLPEKALIDILYFSSLGRYAFDQSALDLKKIDWKKIEKWTQIYPKRFTNHLKDWRKKYERTRKA